MSAKPENTEPEVWEVVSSESGTRVEFDTPGDVFTGVMLRSVTIEQKDDDPFTQYLLYGWGEFPVAELYAINESYKLTPLSRIPEGMLVRLTYVKNVSVGKGNDMKDFRVESRKLPVAARIDYPNVNFG